MYGAFGLPDFHGNRVIMDRDIFPLLQGIGQHPIPVQGVFVAVGFEPDNQLFAGQLTLDPSGYIVAGEDTRTNLDGVFAAGDTRTKTLRQIVTAAGDGAIAAFEAGGYLAAQA